MIQPWSITIIVSLVMTLVLLERTLRVKAVEARTSRNYYNATLIFLLIWAVLDFTVVNLPPDSGWLAGVLTRFVFVIVSIVVFLFVGSEVHFSPRGPLSRIVTMISGVPVLVILLANILGPFPVVLKDYGWQGDVADPALRYTWLGLTILTLLLSFLMVWETRSKVTDIGARRSLSFFLAGHILALVVGVALYILREAFDIPNLTIVGIGIALLVAYPAFSPKKITTAS